MKKDYPGQTDFSIGISFCESMVSTPLPGKLISQPENPEPVFYHHFIYTSTSHPVFYTAINSVNKRREVTVSTETIIFLPAFFLKGTINKRLGFSRPGLI
ncbi:MAG: hypothetical protein ACXWCG_00585 [Flavitalea sp.]